MAKLYSTVVPWNSQILEMQIVDLVQKGWILKFWVSTWIVHSIFQIMTFSFYSTPQKTSWTNCLHFTHTSWNTTQVATPFSKKKDLKRAFLLKYNILLHRYDYWCISLLYCHWNFEQEKDNSNVDNKCFCKQKHKSVDCKSHLFAQSVHKD